MKRKDALQAITAAAANGDEHHALRIYTEHRSIGYAAFLEALRRGQVLKGLVKNEPRSV